jgi:hypothetical protein
MTTDPSPPAPPIRSETIARARRALPAAALLLVLAGSFLVPAPGDDQFLRLASPDRSRVDGMRAAIRDIPVDGLVLVALDADLGTYAEIRAATRAALADLDAHGARVAVVSFTPEGRAIAAAELDRIRRAGVQTVPADLGFIAGSEAGLVRAIASVVPASASGAVVDGVRERGGGVPAFNLVLIVSGSDLSARSWVEQVGARLPELPMAAIAPTFLEPELAPYLRSGQLAALLATLREGVAYAEAVPFAPGAARGATPPALPMLIGMLAALAVLADAAARRLLRSGRAA